jgi:hypothetical protein
MLFGEAYSKGDHLFHVPLRPDMAASQERYYRESVLSAVSCLDPSLPQMLVNATLAYDEIEHDVVHRHSLGLTPEAIIYFNSLLVRGVAEGLRLSSYEETFDSLQRLCDGMNRPSPTSGPERAFCATFVKAVLLHLHLATGTFFPAANRATAMVLHHSVLIETAMMPKRYAHLLSIFYATDPEQYASELAKSSRSGDATTFVEYSINGLVAQMRVDMEQLRDVWPEQRRRIGWINHVHAVLPSPSDPATRRQIDLALAMPAEASPLSQLRQLYGADLLSDLEALAQRSLVLEDVDGWRPRRDLLED